MGSWNCGCIPMVLRKRKVQEEDYTQRRQRAALSWWCELLTLLLTAVYSVIVGYDISQDSPTLSSPRWFEDGFCVAKLSDHLNSHTLCFLADVAVGGCLVLLNVSRYGRCGKQ